MARYRCLPKQTFCLEDYCLQTLPFEALSQIKEWRNEQIAFLRQQVPLTDESQSRYFYEVIQPSYEEEEPPQILFSYSYKGTLIGYGGLVHINWIDQRAEVSFLVDPIRAAILSTYHQDFSTYLKLIKEVAFIHLGFNRLWTECYDLRPYHVQIIEEAGFIYEGRFREQVAYGKGYIDSILHSILASDAFPPPSPGNVLISGISQTIPLLTALKKSLHAISPSIKIIGVGTDPNCLERNFVDEFHLLPYQPFHPQWEEELLSICKLSHITKIIPTCHEELIYYAQIAKKFALEGIWIMVSSPEELSSATNKLSFYTKASGASFPVIPTAKTIEKLDQLLLKGGLESLIGCYVIKDSGLNHTKKIAPDANTAQEYAKTLPNPIFQPFIEGEEFRVDLFRWEGVVWGTICNQCTDVLEDFSQVITICAFPLLEELAIKLAQHLNLSGHLTFKAIASSNYSEIWFLGCSACIGKDATASMAAGLNSILWFYQMTQPQSTFLPPPLTPKPLRQIRYPIDQIEYLPLLPSIGTLKVEGKF